MSKVPKMGKSRKKLLPSGPEATFPPSKTNTPRSKTPGPICSLQRFFGFFDMEFALEFPGGILSVVLMVSLSFKILKDQETKAATAIAIGHRQFSGPFRRESRKTQK